MVDIQHSGRLGILILLPLLAVVASGCSNLPTSVQEVPAGEVFPLRYGESAIVRDAGIIVTFKRLNEDSRCPEELRCFWEGNASVVVSAGDVDLTLNTALMPREAPHAGYVIRLIDVRPYPRHQVERNPGAYTVSLRVTRIDS